MKFIRGITLFVFLAFLPFFLFQGQDKQIFRQMFREAESVLLYLNEEHEALKLFLELDRMDPGNAHIQYKTGLCYLHLPGEKEKAIPWLEKAVRHISSEYKPVYDERNAPPDAWFYLALAYHVNNRFDEAIEAYNTFIETADISGYYDVEYVREQITGCLNAREMVNNPVPCRETKLDRRINAHQVILNPAVSGDGRSMAFTVREGDDFRIYYTVRKNERWSAPEDITDQLRTRGDGITSSLSADGKILIVYRDAGGAGDLYMSYLQNGNWSALEKLNRNINTKYWEANGCLSPDGNSLYFSSNRKGGYGKLDLYRSEKMPDGDWGPARNLGPVINSPLMEDAPYMSATGDILFFSSQGHGSMGGYDHFYSGKTAAGTWSLPVNLGYPVSTADDDPYLAPAGRGDTAYYARLDEETGGHVISRVILGGEEPVGAETAKDIPDKELGEEGKILSEITLKGRVRLQDNKLIPDTAIRVSVVDTVSGKILQTVRPDPETGEYSVSLPSGAYRLIYEAEGYEKQEHHLAVAEHVGNREVRVSTRLAPLEVSGGEYLIIENIYFGFDSWELDREARMSLEKLAGIMHEYPDLEFELIGHTDTVGSQAYNLVLSKRRATAVAMYLFDKGIDRSRLLTEGIGEIIAVRKDEKSVAVGDESRYFRRVEVKLKGDARAEIRQEMELPEYLRPALDLNYTVIVLKVKKRIPDDYFDGYEMEELKYIREQQVSDGYIYTLGSFPQKHKAVQLLGKLRREGFDEATVVDQHELSELVVGEDPDIGFLGKPEKIDEIPWYTIQIFALKEPPHPAAFRGRKDIMSFPCRDGFVRYTIGEYRGFSSALKALPEIRKEWYPDAFIQELEKLEKEMAE